METTNKELDLGLCSEEMSYKLGEIFDAIELEEKLIISGLKEKLTPENQIKFDTCLIIYKIAKPRIMNTNKWYNSLPDGMELNTPESEVELTVLLIKSILNNSLEESMQLDDELYYYLSDEDYSKREFLNFIATLLN
jgi:hypothetical protein